MSNNSNQPSEGGTTFEGLEAFIVDVNTDGVPPSTEEEKVDIDLGKQTTDVEDEPKKEPKVETPTKEEEKAEEGKKEESVETPEVNQSDSYYATLTSKFLEKGKWQDAEIEIEEGNIVKLSELDKIDEDLFFQIEESQSKFNKEDIETNYIKKGDFDENKLKVIEILKNGGDIKDIFETPEEAQRPFEGVDVEDENIQKTVLFNYLTQVQQFNPDDAKLVVGNHIDRGELDTKVKEIVEGYQTKYDTKLSNKLEQVKAEKENRKSKDKEFSKSLEEIYKKYNLDDKTSKRLSTLGTKRTDDGDFELDSVYSEKMENPDEAAELIYFLTDKEGYLKDKMSETKVKTQNDNLRTIKFIKDKQRKSNESTPNNRDGKSAFVIDVE